MLYGIAQKEQLGTPCAPLPRCAPALLAALLTTTACCAQASTRPSRSASRRASRTRFPCAGLVALPTNAHSPPSDPLPWQECKYRMRLLTASRHTTMLAIGRAPRFADRVPTCLPRHVARARGCAQHADYAAADAALHGARAGARIRTRFAPPPCALRTHSAHPHPATPNHPTRRAAPRPRRASRRAWRASRRAPSAAAASSPASPSRSSDDNDSLQMLTRTSQIGEFYVMAPPQVKPKGEQRLHTCDIMHLRRGARRPRAHHVGATRSTRRSSTTEVLRRHRRRHAHGGRPKDGKGLSDWRPPAGAWERLQRGPAGPRPARGPGPRRAHRAWRAPSSSTPCTT